MINAEEDSLMKQENDQKDTQRQTHKKSLRKTRKRNIGEAYQGTQKNFGSIRASKVIFRKIKISNLDSNSSPLTTTTNTYHYHNA